MLGSSILLFSLIVCFEKEKVAKDLMNVSGKLRKQLIVDLSVAFGLGITGGYAFWFGYHIPAVRKRDAYYAKLEAEGTGKGLMTRFTTSDDAHEKPLLFPRVGRSGDL